MTYWKCNSLQLFSVQSMKMSMWYCGIALFYIFFNMSSFFLVYVCISVSLSFIYPSLWKSLGVCFSLCCFLLIFHLTRASFSSLWISLTCSLYLGFIFQLSLSFNLEKDTLFYTVLYWTSSVTTANSETSCISKCSLVKEDKSPPSTSFLEVL